MTERSTLTRLPATKTGVEGPRTLFARFKELHPEIERAIAAGHSRQQIRDWLAKHDITVTLPLYDNYLFRARKVQAPLQQQSSSESTTIAPEIGEQRKPPTAERNEASLAPLAAETNIDRLLRRNEEHKQQTTLERVRWDSTPKKRS